jgi:membrane-bound metal-dependent hydrolase YbcI (DUF457 family)
MDGKTHLKLGITSTIAASICINKYFNNEYLLLTGLIISPIASIVTSQLPDIDSKNSKISQIIPIINWIKSKIFLIIGILLNAASLIMKKYDIIYNDKIFWASLIIVFLHIFCEYCLKHRKLTHCLLMCTAIGVISFFLYYKIQNIITFSISFGLTIGYLSHVLYDCLTTRGCQLFYPFFKFKIKGPLRSSTDNNVAICISYIVILLSVIFYII